ncbi:putative transcription factor protein [Phaeoacremonium minimum UCRPA7]|uniref:Putative transcription factor protein n=1 Tax=Phaeoacremonium minimum (strain UCR-PA7) TaxID=1286976 RepID=R8BR30_PHAM7|nr:putative transcription factor protein [Phaeoacremonium minimum UCRPA7]EOO01789.1 putative transcription factor protein [Phaeoacremonium minimum UCRPA7]
MPEELDINGDEVSDAMSENENDYENDAAMKDEDDTMADSTLASEIGADGSEIKKKYDPKDPLRPRRKKARRACYACQRAHLTCGMGQTLFDPSNPAIFNFNLEALNFGSQYGGLEFAMLGHMSSGAAETPPRDPSLSQQGSGDVNFGSGVFGNGVNQFDTGMIGDFLSTDQSGNGLYSQGNLRHGLPHAYAIAAGPTSLQSPSTENNSPQPSNNFGFEGSPTTTNFGPPPRPKSKPAPPKFGPQSILSKRSRDPTSIYETVKEPFQYVTGFHRLFAILQERYHGNKIIRIAKALGSIRPSFISCTRTLSRPDLVFMEKCFQRTLFEYEDFMLSIGSPCLVLRRTGEVAAVNKEFSALTGWSKDILLGKEANLNVNTGSAGTSGTNSGRGGLNTPKLRSLNADAAKASEGKPQPIFIAELMDDDSVVEFYEDYAHLAFGDSRGSVTRKGRLLKYRTQENLDSSASAASTDESPKDPRSSILSHRVARIDGEHGISKIERDGKLECTYCWHIRRDTFDIPMMIVMNFLPCYYPNQEPHQLAV